PSYGDLSPVPKGLIKALEDLKLAKNGACNKAGAETQNNNSENSDKANVELAIQTFGPDQATLMGSTGASQKRRKITADCPMEVIDKGEAVEKYNN
ncbi:hypothetical protein A2U01_0075573, partial [Trifolium medium]|nr:hypothetical protein [Trifolium medium]